MREVIIVPGYDALGIGIEAYFVELKKELESEGFKVHIFGDYNENTNLPETLKRVDLFIKRNKIKRADFIGFSLGAHILLHFIEKKNRIRMDKALLVFPLIGGSIAGRIGYATGILGHSKNSVLYEASHHDMSDYEIPKNISFGIIQGTKRTNKVFPGSYPAQLFFLFRKNDGLLMEHETMLNNCGKNKNCRHVSVHADHFTATGNKKVISQIKNFLEKGKFIE